MKTSLIVAIMAIIFFSCDSPLDRPYKEETLEEDLVEIKSTLSDEESKMLVGFISLAQLSDENKFLGKTYKDILNDARELKKELEAQQKEQEELAEKTKAEETDRIKRLGGAVTVSMYDKGYFNYNYNNYLTYDFAFQNKTDKDIRAFKGMVYFNDLFDEEISRISFTYDKGVPADSTVKWSGQTEYNQFDSEDVAFKNKDIEDIKIKWVPEKIIFSDGSTPGMKILLCSPMRAI